MFAKLIAKYYDLIFDDEPVCSRKDYGIFFLIYIATGVVLLLVSTTLSSFGFDNVVQLPVFLLSVVSFIFLTVLSIKRLHDVNLCGWWIFFPFIFLIMLFSPSSTINNRYLGYANTEMTKKDIEESENLEKFIELLEKEKTKG